MMKLRSLAPIAAMVMMAGAPVFAASAATSHTTQVKHAKVAKKTKKGSTEAPKTN